MAQNNIKKKQKSVEKMPLGSGMVDRTKKTMQDRKKRREETMKAIFPSAAKKKKSK